MITAVVAGAATTTAPTAAGAATGAGAGGAADPAAGAGASAAGMRGQAGGRLVLHATGTHCHTHWLEKVAGAKVHGPQKPLRSVWQLRVRPWCHAGIDGWVGVGGGGGECCGGVAVVAAHSLISRLPGWSSNESRPLRRSETPNGRPLQRHTHLNTRKKEADTHNVLRS
jgi:hypothetical protein